MKFAYQEDLAYIHDAGFTDFVRDATPGLMAILRRNQIKNGLIVDLGCGSGVWAETLTQSGYAVLGVDVSGSMLKLARRRTQRAEFVRASLFRVRLPACRAVTAIGECVNYLFDRGNSPGLLRRFFRRVHGALEPGGVFIFDVAEPGRVAQRGPVLKHTAGKDWAILVSLEEDPKTHILTRHMTIFRQIGQTYRRTHETHRQQLYSRKETLGLLKDAGFKAEVMNRYGKLKLLRGQVAFVAKKE